LVSTDFWDPENDRSVVNGLKVPGDKISSTELSSLYDRLRQKIIYSTRGLMEVGPRTMSWTPKTINHIIDKIRSVRHQSQGTVARRRGYALKYVWRHRLKVYYPILALFHSCKTRLDSELATTRGARYFEPYKWFERYSTSVVGTNPGKLSSSIQDWLSSL
jgi:hypothetical protein